jgi:hypothetical protein
MVLPGLIDAIIVQPNLVQSAWLQTDQVGICICVIVRDNKCTKVSDISKLEESYGN